MKGVGLFQVAYVCEVKRRDGSMLRALVTTSNEVLVELSGTDMYKLIPSGEREGVDIYDRAKFEKWLKAWDMAQ